MRKLLAVIGVALMLAVVPTHLHKERHHTVRVVHRSVWHTTRLLVTEYVVDHESGCDTYPGTTASGVRAHRGSVAVYTRQFPFGTRFYIPHYGYGRADDTGGAVGWGHIDAAVTSTHKRTGCQIAIDWGARHLNVLWR